jgi:hypothetical protein
VFLLEAYRNRNRATRCWPGNSPCKPSTQPWTRTIAELCEHSVEIALNIGIRNGLTEQCEVFIDETI